MMLRVAIIGAGMAGLTCGIALRDAGFSPVVFEKSRGFGGRLATRRLPDGQTFDHGAQYITARDEDFKTWLAQACAAGDAARWHPVVAGPDGGAAPDLFVGVPSMNAFLKARAVEAELDVRLRTTVQPLHRDGSGWRVADSEGAGSEVFDIVVSTAPPPQARRIMAADADMTDALAAVAVRPCWTLMAGFATPLDVPFDTWRDNAADIVWMARNTAKPGRADDGEAWVVHAGPDWSEAHLEWERDAVAAGLVSMMNDIVGGELPTPVYTSAHRWRYALTVTPLGAPFARNGDATLYAGGDWALGARVEFAYMSGRAIAAAIIGED